MKTLKSKITRKNILSLFLILIGVAVLGLNNRGLKLANATSLYSDYTAQKLQTLSQENTKLMQQANQYHAAHPASSPETIPMAPDPKQKVERIPQDAGWGIGWLYNGPYNVSELWIVGDKPNYEQHSWNSSYAYSGSLKDNPQQGFIGTFVMNGASDNSWSGNWNTPKLWGSVKITDVSGDIVSFVTDSGATGTFNLDTHEWKTN